MKDEQKIEKERKSQRRRREKEMERWMCTFTDLTQKKKKWNQHKNTHKISFYLKWWWLDAQNNRIQKHWTELNYRPKIDEFKLKYS